MRNIFFDLCAIPLFVLMLWTCHLRKMTKGQSNRVFLMLNVASLICAVTDVLMEVVVNPVPLPGWAVVLGSAISYTYLVFRNSELVLYLIFIFSITRTEFKIRSKKSRFLLWAPNGFVVALLILNLFNHQVFSVTAQEGYARGPWMIGLYAVAALYGVAGTIYCVYCKRYLTASKWVALLSVYVLTFIAVAVQFIWAELLVEMFSTALGLMMIMLLVMRPEEAMDTSVGIESWEAYQTDLKNVLLAGEPVRIMVLRMMNAQEIRAYLGEDQYNQYIMELSDEMRSFFKGRQIPGEMYFERPANIYLMLGDAKYDAEKDVPEMLSRIRERIKRYADVGVRFEPKICLIRYPEDLRDMKDILNLGHKFPHMGLSERTVYQASDIVHSHNFDIINNMDTILNRAVKENRIEMYYQPIYHIESRSFRSAEALARLMDREFGMISPGVFIPAAETMGLILPIGDVVLESVFRFISEHDLNELGLSYIEINLSVAQCMQADLPDTIRQLQKKYRVLPTQVNFEITETLFDNISSVMEKNLRELCDMGYSFSLDDYGIGYSNIQRLSRLPLSIIKIDKSLVDEMFSPSGQVIIENTLRMMQGIHKKLVVEGVETKEEIDALMDMSCDFIQGFYYSKPLPEDRFVTFLRDHNQPIPA